MRLVWYHHFRAKLLRLNEGAAGKGLAGNAGWKAHIILDTARGPSLAADRNVFHDQRAQTFGPRIDSRSDPSGPATYAYGAA